MAYTLPETPVSQEIISSTTFGLAIINSLTELQTRIPTLHVVNGVAGTTSGATVLTIATLSIPARTVAGIISFQYYVRVFKTVLTDVFSIRVLDDVTVVGESQTYQGSAYEWIGFTGYVSVSANTAKTLIASIYRIAGTGTASVILSEPNNNMVATYVPTGL